MQVPKSSPAVFIAIPELPMPDEPTRAPAGISWPTEEREFEQALLASRGKLLALAHRLLGWRGDAEDAVQNAVARALDSRAQYRGEAALETWLCRIVINECRRVARWRRMRAWVGLDDVDVPTRFTVNASREAERVDAVRRAMASLAYNYREVAVLRYLQDMEIEEIAEILGKRRGAVDTLLSRAREMLRIELAGWMDDETLG